MKPLLLAALCAVVLGIGGCGSSQPPASIAPDSQAATPTPSSPPPASSSAITSDQASAFLSRATFGATPEGIEQLKKKGYERWLQEQFSKQPTLHTAWIESHAKGIEGVPDLKKAPEDWKTYSDALGDMQLDAWWDIVVHAPDQLRQRVAFALSEIMVVSKYGPLATFPDARVSYYDTLVTHAFDNFETLLKAVTYHPAMGRYLSYLGNAKAGKLGAHPDENYAREVMQLFSIGLYRLNRDGSYQKDADGQPLHTYTQKDVTEMAKVFTGLTDDNGQFLSEASFDTHHSRTTPMVAVEEYHDTTQKRILGTRILAGGTTKEDIDKALHILFMHPNTGPFISRRLIQHLVTSNPSPAYIERVAKVFEDNGHGVRGDMKAVIEAILLDEEALHGTERMPQSFGKLREPLLFVSHLFRAFHAKNGEHTLTQGDKKLYKYRSFNLHETGMTKQEGPLSALTVFNYFTPDDGPFSLKKRNLTAPELTIYGKSGLDDVLMGLIHKNDFVYTLFNISADLQIDDLKAMLHQKAYSKALSSLDTLLCAGHLSEQSKKAILDYLKRQHPKEGDDALARHLIGLIMTSPDYALQR